MLPTILIGIAIVVVIALGLLRLFSALNVVSKGMSQETDSTIADEVDKESGTWLARD